MRLYHGTSDRHLGAILAHGITLRSGTRGNWSSFPSRRGCVYLTTVYPFLFAMASLRTKAERAVVLEVDRDRLDMTLLEPDEDAIAQAIAMREGGPLQEVHARVRRSFAKYRHFWRESLHALGCCAYRGTVPPEAITRYCVFDPRARTGGHHLESAMTDAQVSILNHRFCREKYEGLVQWMFGDRTDLLRLAGPGVTEELGDIWKQVTEHWVPEARDRSGIQVVTFRPPGGAANTARIAGECHFA